MIETMNNLSQAWWIWSVGMFWQVGILILIVGCLDILIRRWAWPHVRYALWLMVLVKLVMPPGIHMSSSLTARVQPQVSYWILPASEKVGNETAVPGVEKETPEIRAKAPVLAVTDTPTVLAPASLHSAVSDSAKSWPLAHAVPLRASLTWRSWTMLSWFAGVVFLSLWLVLRLRHLRLEDTTLAQQAQLPESFYQMAQRCADQIGLARCPRIIITDKVIVPAVTGMFRPLLLMPAGFLAQLDRKDTEHMLLHEFSHIKRGDLVVHGIYMMLQLAYWYNPLLWLASRQMHHLRELCCDATVAHHLRGRALEYRQTLLDVARRYLARSVEPGLGLLGLFEDSNRLAVRLNWLKKQTWRYRRTRNLLIAGLVIAMGICILPMAQAQNDAVSETPVVSEASTVSETPIISEVSVVAETPITSEVKVSEEENALLQELEGLRRQQQVLKEQLEQLKQKKAELTAVQKADSPQQEEDSMGWTESIEVWAEQLEEKVKTLDTWINSPDVQKQIQKKGQAWVKQWTDSEDFQQWQKDIQVWSQDVAGLVQKKWQGLATGLPPMPPLPPLPATLAMPEKPKKPKPPAQPQPNAIAVPAIVANPAPSKVSQQEELTLVKDVTFEVSPGNLIEMFVENPMGAVRIRGTKDSNQVKVLIKVKAKSQEQAKTLADRVAIKGENGGHQFSIKGQPLPPNIGNDVKVNFDIIVPTQVEVLELKSNLGAVAVSNIKGHVDAHTKVGAISLQGVEGRMNLHSQVGSINLILPNDTSAQVEAEVNIGAINTDLDLPVRRTGMGAKLKGKLGQGQHEIKLKTQTGAISIRSQGKHKQKNSGKRTVAAVTAGTAPKKTTGKNRLKAGPFTRHINSIKDYQEGQRHVVQRQETQLLPLKPGQWLNLINKDGDVTVRGEDRQDGHLTATFTIKAPGKPDAQRLSKQVSLDVIEKEGGLVIQPDIPKKLPQGHHVFINLTLAVPRDTRLEVKHEDGDVALEDLAASAKLVHEDGDVICKQIGKQLEVIHEDGDVKLQKIGGPVTLQLEDGDIECQHVQDKLTIEHEDGDLRLLHVNGSVKLGHEDGNIDCQHVAGGVELLHADGNIKLHHIGGSVKIEHEDGNIVCDTVGGSLKLNHEDGNVQLQTIGGTVDINHEDGMLTCRQIAGPLNASHQDGKIELQGVAGDVTLDHESGAIVCRQITGALAIQHTDGAVAIDSLIGPLTLKMDSGNASCNNLQSHARIRLADGNVKLSYPGTVSPECRIDVQVNDGHIQLTGGPALLGSATPASPKRKGGGSQWQTTIETDQTKHTIKLQTKHGSIRVNKN